MTISQQGAASQPRAVGQTHDASPRGAIRRARALLAHCGGAAALEFALVAAPFVAMIFAILQIGLIYLAGNELETAVERAARPLLTGSAQQASLTQSQFLTSVCSYLPALFSCSGLMVDLQVASAFSSANTAKPTLIFDSSGKVTNQWSFSTGSSGSILVLRVFYQFPILFAPFGRSLANLANGDHLLMATAVFQVEPYAAGN